MKTIFVAFALVAGLVCVQAAGGIKGRQPTEDGQQRLSAAKAPFAARPAVQQQQQPVYLQPAAPQAPLQQAIKAGPGQVAPVFTAARVQPQAPQPIAQQQLFQQQQVQQQEPEIVQQQQQQQQQEEIDPNAAAQDSSAAVLAPARVAPAAAAPAASEEEANPRPEPYNFQYSFESGDSATSGSSTREEQQDASGRVTGFYTLKGEDGRDRRVEYFADATGFHATINTNELGTAAKDSADVDWNAQNPSDAQLRAAESATQAARARALANPQQLQQQPISSASSSSFGKISSPRQKGAASSSQQASNGLSKANLAAQQQQQLQQQQEQQQQVSIGQLQEPFEQIRQTELNTRARKSRHAPFYLFTV